MRGLSNSIASPVQTAAYLTDSLAFPEHFQYKSNGEGHPSKGQRRFGGSAREATALSASERALLLRSKLPQKCTVLCPATQNYVSHASNTHMTRAELSANGIFGGHQGGLASPNDGEEYLSQAGFFLWHQAFHREYRQHYYYCRASRSTQWEAPTVGFVPLGQTQDLLLDREKWVERESTSYHLVNALSIPHPKYWSQRHRLFSLFDHGILLDAESWFSVTPERIAHHQARRCINALRKHSKKYKLGVTDPLVVLDAFCGVGGNTIAFARNHSVRVVACDDDLSRLKLAANNAAIYGVSHAIDFVQGDTLASFKRMALLTRNGSFEDEYHMIFLSPPWGGPEYLSVQNFDLRAVFVSGKNFVELLQLALEITENVMIFLPRNSDLQPLTDAVGVPFEVEQNYLNGKLKSISVYFGLLMKC